jgi:protein phosphatase
MAGQAIAACIRKQARIRRHSTRQLLELALHTAAVEVFTAAQQRRDYRGMGTTVVACLVVDPTHVVIGHAGDSRAYLLRDEELVALTRDHTVAQDLVDAGARSLHEMEGSPEKHWLTRNLGRAYGVRPDVLEQTLEPGDRLLLCSDGLYGGTSVGSIRRVLASRDAPEQVAHKLVELVLRGEASDNVSAIVLAVEGGRVRTARAPAAVTHPTRRPRAPGPRKARR